MSETYTRLTEIGRVSIDEHPAIVGKKERLGDWEADTIIGKEYKGVLVTLADHVSKKTLIAAVPCRCGDSGNYSVTATSNKLS